MCQTRQEALWRVFYQGQWKSWCGICGAFVARLAQLDESDVTFNKQPLSQYLNN
jgi:hypothetical protein